MSTQALSRGRSQSQDPTRHETDHDPNRRADQRYENQADHDCITSDIDDGIAMPPVRLGYCGKPAKQADDDDPRYDSGASAGRGKTDDAC
jgi:hypothetical protein